MSAGAAHYTLDAAEVLSDSGCLLTYKKRGNWETVSRPGGKKTLHHGVMEGLPDHHHGDDRQ
jgi:hypothetical protein